MVYHLPPSAAHSSELCHQWVFSYMDTPRLVYHVHRITFPAPVVIRCFGWFIFNWNLGGPSPTDQEACLVNYHLPYFFRG